MPSTRHGIMGLNVLDKHIKSNILYDREWLVIGSLLCNVLCLGTITGKLSFTFSFFFLSFQKHPPQTEWVCWERLSFSVPCASHNHNAVQDVSISNGQLNPMLRNFWQMHPLFGFQHYRIYKQLSVGLSLMYQNMPTLTHSH